MEDRRIEDRKLKGTRRKRTTRSESAAESVKEMNELAVRAMI